MKNKLIIFLLFLIITGLHASVEVISSNPQELVFVYRLDPYQINNEGEFSTISAVELSSDIETGAPDLPYSEQKIAIPPGASIQVEVLEQRIEEQALSKILRPIPELIEQNDVWVTRYHPDEAKYANSIRPVLEILAAGAFRSYHFVPLRINPFQYDGFQRLRVVSELKLRVLIRGNTSYRSSIVRDDFSDTILSHLINPVEAVSWRQEQRAAISYADFARSDWWIRIETDSDGMYKISRNQISSFPLADLDPRSLRLFTTGGEVLPQNAVQQGAQFREVPILVAGESDGVFNNADYIVFYGSSRNGLSKNGQIGTNHYFNPYSPNTVYWLTFGGDFSGEPLRMGSLPAYESFDLETNTFIDTYRRDEERFRRDIHGFNWYMGRFFGNTTADYQYQVELPDLDPSQDKVLRFEIIQEIVDSYITHQISVNVNGTQLQSGNVNPNVFTWPNIQNYGFEQVANSLQEGTNTITLRLIRDRTINYFLDYIQIKYARFINKTAGQFSIFSSDSLRRVKYNISGDNSNLEAYLINSQYSASVVPVQNGYVIADGTNGARIQLLKPTEYLNPMLVQAVTPVNLLADPEYLDNLIIAPAEFINAAQELASIYRTEYGINTRVVDQQAIFNQFNGGHPDPVALRQYIRYVYHNFPNSSTGKKLSSLTLLGLGTIDWVNNSRQAATKNKLIVWQRSSTQTSTLTDDWFGMLSQDSFPELAIGRYPAKTLSELNTMINNFRDYSINPIPGWWRNSVVLLADDLYNGPNTFYEDDHTIQVQHTASLMNPSVFADKIFAWNYPYDEFQNKPTARDRMISSINEGKLAWIYIGHGSYDNLGTEDYFNGSTDIGRLNNGKRMPFFVAMSCKVSNFDYWGFDSLGETLVLRNGNGAIASWSATRISFPGPNSSLLYQLVPRMINQRQNLGQAIMNAKIAFTGDSYNESVYVLLGDPHLRVYPPQTIAAINPTFNNADQVFKARETVSFTGQFDSDLNLNGTAELIAYDTDYSYRLDNVNVSEKGNPIFKGSISIANDQFSGAFVIPDDVRTGSTASIVTYYWDTASKRDYLSYYAPMKLSDEAVVVANQSAPQIDLYLSTLDFRAGDVVGENPLLLARISDDNGINITGNAGRNILLVIDGSLQPISVTQYFSYDTDSHTSGTLRYQLPTLSEGPHTIQLIAFDSFNLPAVASTNFQVRSIGEFNLERFLIYPNPMQQQTSFTFLLSEDADLRISIYTIRGRRIRSFESRGRAGFNTIPWDGRDEAGNRLANNTYFVKLRAVNPNGTVVEKTERVVIYN